jgi:hypothetical protein
MKSLQTVTPILLSAQISYDCNCSITDCREIKCATAGRLCTQFDGTVLQPVSFIWKRRQHCYISHNLVDKELSLVCANKMALFNASHKNNLLRAFLRHTINADCSCLHAVCPGTDRVFKS